MLNHYYSEEQRCCQWNKGRQSGHEVSVYLISAQKKTPVLAAWGKSYITATTHALFTNGNFSG